jgi:prophage antirepressor-like protein
MNIKVEKWNEHEIRFVWHNGEWWAVAKDVVDALGIKNTTRAMSGVSDKHKGLHTVKGLNRANEPVNIVDEIGIYQLVFKSRKKEAEEFREWVYEVIKELRQRTGLEGFQVFRMMDKEHQKKAMAQIKETLGVQAEQKHYIKANTIANKAVSNRYGLDKSIKKDDMTPEMLKDRQPILEEAAQLTAIKDAYGLDFSVSKAIYKKFGKKESPNDRI